VNFAGCCTQPAIRGISTLTTGPGFENNVAVYVDGFYTPDNITVNGDLANISSIEVLKGPQGTLWGRNATGGAILINTLAPSKTLTGKLQASYGRYDDKSLTGYISGPISDRVRFAVAAYGRKSDGYIKALDATGKVAGDAAPQRQASIRTKLEFEVTDKLTATLGYNYGLSRDARGQIFTVMQYSFAVPPAPPRASQPNTASTNRWSDLLGITNEGTLKLVYRTSVGDLTSYTGVAERKTKGAFDFDGSFADLFFSESHYSQDTFQQGVDFNLTAIENLDLVIGGTYYRDRFKVAPQGQNGYAGNRLTSTFKNSLHTEAWAAYVDGAYHVTEAFTLNLGARYTEEKKDAYYVTVLPTGAALGLPGKNGATFTAFTPRASIRYELTPRSNVYASLAKGFRTGGFQPSGAASPDLFTPYRPEKITAYEVGYKTAASRLQFSAAAFYYDYKDLQIGVTIPNPNGTGGLINTVINAKKAEVYGLDAELSVEPVDYLNLRIGAAWLHGRYKDFPNATGTGLNAATGLNITNQIQNWSGKQMIRSPNFSGNLGVDYEFQDVVGGKLLVGANARYTSSFATNAASLYGRLAGPRATKQRYRQGAYALVNAQATWTDPSGHYRVGAFVNNLTDKRYRLTYSGGAFGDYSTWASPRTYGVRVGYEF
jgi:iron complex outermembrane receptor protein